MARDPKNDKNSIFFIFDQFFGHFLEKYQKRGVFLGGGASSSQKKGGTRADGDSVRGVGRGGVNQPLIRGGESVVFGPPDQVFRILHFFD